MKLVKVNKEKFNAIRCIDKTVPVYHLGFNLKDIPEQTAEHNSKQKTFNAEYYFVTLVGVPNVENIKHKLIELVNEYDKSARVNSFIVEDKESWLNKTERASIKNAIEVIKNNDKKEFTLWIGLESYKLSIEESTKFINDLENYSIDCYNVTKQHLANIEKLNTVEELLAYDFTANYPDKITLK